MKRMLLVLLLLSLLDYNLIRAHRWESSGSYRVWTATLGQIVGTTEVA